MPFKISKTKIQGLLIIENIKFGDERGFFMETYKASDFEQIGITEKFVQDSTSLSGKNVLRGLHYQLSPSTQGKLVRVARGKIWDVAVDIRKDSSTFGQWEGVELSEENHLSFYLPPGMAHGFVVLSDDAEVIYKMSSEYNPLAERGIRWNDPAIDIKWPIDNPRPSKRDLAFPLLKNAELL